MLIAPHALVRAGLALALLAPASAPAAPTAGGEAVPTPSTSADTPATPQVEAAEPAAAPAEPATAPSAMPTEPAAAPAEPATAPSAMPAEPATALPTAEALPEAGTRAHRPPRSPRAEAPKALLAVGVVSLATAFAAGIVAIDAAVDTRDLERRIARGSDPAHPEDALGEEDLRALEDRLERERDTVVGATIASAGLGTIGVALSVSGLVLRHRRVAPYARGTPSGGMVGVAGRF